MMNHVQPIRDISKIEEMKNILKRKNYRDYFLFMFGINSGLRISDILRLRVKDVKGQIHISLKEKKTGKAKRLKINNSLQNEIAQYIKGMNDDDYLFPSRNGQGVKPTITRVRAYMILNEAARVAGISEVGTHTLRKTFGYHFYQKTKDVALLQEIFNHSAPSITLRYIGINQDIIDSAIDDFSL